MASLKDLAERIKRSLSLNPDSYGGDNFWTTPVGKGFAGFGARAESSTLPKVDLQQFTNRISNPVPRTLANFGANIASDLINTPQRLLQGGARGGAVIRDFSQSQPVTPGRVIGAGAAIAEPLLDIATLGGASLVKGIGKQSIKQVGKEGLKQVIKQGAKKGAIEGAVFGGLRGLSEGPEATLPNFIQGAGAGAVFGGTLGAGASGVSGLLKFTQHTPETINQLRDLGGKWAKGKTPIKPARMDVPAWEFQLKFNKQYNRNPYTPVFADDLKRAGLYEGEKRIGMQARNINLDKNPLGEVVPNNRTGNYTNPLGSTQPAGGKTKSNTQLQGELPIPPKTNLEASLDPIIREKGQLNLNKLNVAGDGLEQLKGIEAKVKPTVIGNKEVVSEAIKIKGAKTPITDAQMKSLMAKQLKNRQQVVDLTSKYNKAKSSGASEQDLAKILLDMSNQSKVARQGSTFAGRLLQAQNIMADTSAPPMQKIFAMLDAAGVDNAKYIKDAINVNFDNPTEVVKFYRKYVPPKFGELLDEYRYSNMLSSPLTHIVNIASNFTQTSPVAVVEKTISGALDFGRTKLTGKERQYYTSAGLDYASGYIKSLPQAIKKAVAVLGNKEMTIRPDYEYMPTGVGGLKGVYTTPLKALEAMDQFFKTLVEGGVTNELKKGPRNISIENISDMAQKESNYRLFRQAFDPNGDLGQGVVLKTFDKWNSAIANLRRLPGGKWVLPFLQTPTNILKQGVEYSPLGFTTAIGAKDPIPQLSKAIIGTGVFAGAYQLAQSGLLSWDAPSSKTERDLYYSAGLQPYSVKVGDKWVSFSKLGPLSYSLAMAAALADAEKNKPDQGAVENIASSIGGMLGFFGDQSYVRSIGDLVDAIQGGTNFKSNAIAGQAANFAGQLVPYKSYLTWLGRIVDPVYRQASTFSERMMKDIPGLSNSLEPYTNSNGEPSTKDFPLANSVSPFKIAQEKSSEKGLYDQYKNIKISNDVEKRADEKFLSESKQGGQTGKQAGKQFRYIDENGSVKRIDLEWTPPDLKLTGDELLDKKVRSDFNSELTKRGNDIYKLYEQGQITQAQAEAELQKLADIKSKASGSASKKVQVSRSKVSYSMPKISKSSTPKLQAIKIGKAPAVKMTKPKQYNLKVGSGTKVPAIKVKSFGNTLTGGQTRLG